MCKFPNSESESYISKNAARVCGGGDKVMQ